MAKFLVTGGAGFIGSNIIAELISNNHEVICYDNLITGNLNNISKSNNLRFIKGDIINKSFLEKSMNNMDYVIHTAALISVKESFKNPALYNNININGTINVLNAALKNNVKKVVFSSSSAIYGDNLNHNISESANINPLSPYAVTKITSEYYLNLYNKLYGLKSVSLRYFNVFGPKQNINSSYAAVIPNFINALLNKKRPIIFGDGKQTRDFVYVKDVVNANIMACKRNVSGESINIASEKSISINDLFINISQMLNSKIIPVYKEAREGDIRYSSADITKSKKFLNLKLKHDFSKGISETIEWYKKNEK